MPAPWRGGIMVSVSRGELQRVDLDHGHAAEAGLDPREIEQLRDDVEQMLAAAPDVVDVFAIGVAADRPEHAQTRMISAKPMIAFSGVRSSWLMLARKRDFAAFAVSASNFAVFNSRSSRAMSSVWVASRTIACCSAVSRSFSAWMSRPTDCSSTSPVIGERTICAFQLHQRLAAVGMLPLDLDRFHRAHGEQRAHALLRDLDLVCGSRKPLSAWLISALGSRPTSLP